MRREGPIFIIIIMYHHHILYKLFIGRRGTLGGGGGRRLSTVAHLCTCLRGADALQIFLVNSKSQMSQLTKNFVLIIQELYASSFLWPRMIRSTWFASFWSLERNQLAVLSIRCLIVVVMVVVVVVVDQVLDFCGGCGGPGSGS